MRNCAASVSFVVVALIAAGCDSQVELTGPTRIATLHDGEPVVVDVENQRVAVAWSEESHGVPTQVQIGRDGKTVAFCVHRDKNGGIVPMAGPIGEMQQVPSKATRCMEPRPFKQGLRLLWTQYGRDELGAPLQPEHVVRFTDLRGNSLPGDANAGASQIWSPRISRDEKWAFAIFGDSSGGPIWRISLDSGQASPAGKEKIRTPFDVDSSDRIVGGYVNELRTLDPATGAEAVAFSFPSYGSPNCDINKPDTKSGCFLRVEQPRWSPDGRRVVFYARSTHPKSSDTDGDIFVVTLGAKSLLRITDDNLWDRSPVFSADGSWIFWVRGRDLVRAPADGSGPPEVWIAGGFGNQLDVAWVATD
jgi:WD40-like Beta Propeller Repeat